MAIIDANNVFYEVNQTFCGFLGYEASRLLGRLLLEVIHPEDVGGFEQARKTILTGQISTITLELRCLRSDAGVIHARVSLERVGCGSDNVSCLLMQTLDLTDQKQLEEELLYRENKFRTLAENLPSVILRYDRECCRVYANPAYLTESGFIIEEVVNTDVATQWQADISMSVEEYKAKLRQVMDTGIPTELVLEWPHRITGRMTTFAFQIVAENGRDGNVIGALVIGHNITALKEAEKHLAESHAQLRELAARREATREEERRHIAREIHDEFGQLLTAIRMEVSILKQQNEEETTKFEDSVQRIVALVDRTILEVRNMASMLRPAALEAGIVAALEWLADEFTARTAIPCELQHSEDVFELDESHSTAIFRIVQEALTNIARHADADRVTVVLEQKGVGCTLKVSDNGKGFDARNKKANSLGLVGVRERVFMLNGEMTIAGMPGQGTVLEVYLPGPVIELRN